MKTVVRLAALLSVLAPACRTLPPAAFGPLREVAVVSSQWGAVEPVVRAILQSDVMTPQPEPEFKVRVGSPDRFDTYSKFRIVLLIGSSRDTIMRQVLGARVDSLPDGDYGLFRIPNAWVLHQSVIVFVAASDSLLLPGLERYSLRLHRTMADAALDQMREATYYSGVDRVATDSLGARYSFTLDVPRKWIVNEDHAAGAFVYAHVHYPDRSVFVHWSEGATPLVQDSLVALRDSLAALFYDGDSVQPGYTVADTVAFLGTAAVRLQGVWGNDRETVGGPFVSYSFTYQGRFYMVDGMVFNPGKKKLDDLLQVEAVVRTFTPK